MPQKLLFIAILTITFNSCVIISYAQTDSIKYTEMLVGKGEKKWYLDKQQYLGGSNKKCHGNALIIQLTAHRITVESCDKKKVRRSIWKIYKDAREIWHFVYDKNDYEMVISDNTENQKMILTQRKYTSYKKWTYLYIKE